MNQKTEIETEHSRHMHDKIGTAMLRGMWIFWGIIWGAVSVDAFLSGGTKILRTFVTVPFTIGFVILLVQSVLDARRNKQQKQ